MKIHLIKSEQGMTLTELMAAVSIVAILAGIGAGTFFGRWPHYQLNAAARDFVADLRLARQQAATENRQYAVQFLSPTAYRIVRGDQGSLQQSQTLSSVLERDYRGSAGGRSQVQVLVPILAPVFHPDGMISSWDNGQGGFDSRTPDEVLFANRSQETKTVSISRLGRIQIR